MGRRARRGALTVALVASLALTAVSAWRLGHDPAVGWVVPRAAEGAAARIEGALARRATAGRLAARIAVHLEAAPRNWLAIAALREVAAERGVVLPAPLSERLAAAHAADHAPSARMLRCGRCLMDSAACDLTLVLACRAPVDLTPLGDVAALLRQGARGAAGAAVDRVEIGLALAGLLAVPLVLVPGGAGPAVKVGAGAARFLHRSGRLAPGLAAPLQRAAAGGVDWARVPAARDLGDLRALARPAAVAPAAGLLADAGRLAAAAGGRPALHLIGRAARPADLAAMSRAAEALGPRTLGRFEVLGKARFLRAVLRPSRTALSFAAGLSGAVAALLALMWQAGLAGALRGLRRRLGGG